MSACCCQANPKDDVFNSIVSLVRQGKYIVPEGLDLFIQNQEGTTIAHELAYAGILPEGFTHWEARNNNGFTVAHYAAHNGHLPKGFNQWHLYDNNGLPVAHYAAARDTLPEDFNQWFILDKFNSTSVFEFYLEKHHRLPKGFKDWDMPINHTKTGREIWEESQWFNSETGEMSFAKAYELLMSDSLPEGFNRWDLEGLEGSISYTLGHIAANNNKLPEGFNQWYLKTNIGWTVAHSAASEGNLPDGFNEWHLKDNRGVTVAHVAATTNCLPEDFDQWDLLDNSGRPVAYLAAENQETFKRVPVSLYLLKGDDGMTVFEKYLKETEIISSDFPNWDYVLNPDGDTCKDIYDKHETEWSLMIIEEGLFDIK